MMMVMDDNVFLFLRLTGLEIGPFASLRPDLPLRNSFYLGPGSHQAAEKH